MGRTYIGSPCGRSISPTHFVCTRDIVRPGPAKYDRLNWI